MTTSAQPAVLRLSALPRRTEIAVHYEPDAPARAGLVQDLTLSALRKARLTGQLIPEGRRDWRIEAVLGATVVQPCGLTLEPVTTRIEAPVRRRYLADYAPPTETESEVPEDDSAEPLPETLDLKALFAEALALEIPPFPRAPGAELGAVQAAPAGAPPLTDAAMRPFAALAALKKPPED